MHFITPSLAVGGLAEAGDADMRQAHRIDAVLSLLDVDFDAGEHHATIAIADREPFRPSALAAAMAFIDGQVRAGRRVLVHCQMGISRSPAVAAAYLHEATGTPIADALAWVCARRPQAEPHPALVHALHDHYERRATATTDAPVADLSANENPLGPSPLAIAAMHVASAAGHRYPDRHGAALRDALAARLAVPRDQVILGNGSCELLDLVARACLAPGDRALIATPSFLPYQSAVGKAHGELVRVPLAAAAGDQATLTALTAQVDERTRLIILGHPNNPTGTALGRAALDDFLDRLPAGVTVLVDEAYREYLDDADAADAVACVRAGRPVVAVRTFSKFYALAGLRIGYAVAPPAQMAAIEALRPHYNTSAVAQAGALAALGDSAHGARSLAANRDGMAALVAGCTALGLEPVPSAANFLLVRSGAADHLSAVLERHGVRVKSGTPFGLPEHLRISVGNAADNARCLAALRAALAGARSGTPAANHRRSKAW